MVLESYETAFLLHPKASEITGAISRPDMQAELPHKGITSSISASCALKKGVISPWTESTGSTYILF